MLRNVRLLLLSTGCAEGDVSVLIVVLDPSDIINQLFVCNKLCILRGSFISSWDGFWISGLNVIDG